MKKESSKKCQRFAFLKSQLMTLKRLGNCISEATRIIQKIKDRGISVTDCRKAIRGATVRELKQHGYVHNPNP